MSEPWTAKDGLCTHSLRSAQSAPALNPEHGAYWHRRYRRSVGAGFESRVGFLLHLLGRPEGGGEKLVYEVEDQGMIWQASVYDGDVRVAYDLEEVRMAEWR